MGLILDSSVAIAGERREMSVEDMLRAVKSITGPTGEPRIRPEPAGGAGSSRI